MANEDAEVPLEQGDVEIVNPEVTLDSMSSISYTILVVQVWTANTQLDHCQSMHYSS